MPNVTCRLILLAAGLLSATVTLVAQEPPRRTDTKGSPDRTTAGKTAAKKTPAKKQRLFDGKSLDGWTVVGQFDFARHGKVRVIGGAMELQAGEPGTAVRWSGKFPRDNYEVTLQAMRVEGDDFFCGLTFPVGKEYCSLILGGWGGMVVGLSNIDGQSAVENETTQAEKFKPKTWYSIRLRVVPKAIEVWLDNESLIRVERKDREFSIWWEQEPVRPFGIATWRTTGRFRNIELRRF